MKQTGIRSRTERLAWKAPQAHCERVRKLHLRKLFGDDQSRGERLAAEAVGVYLDYSKNHITDETLKRLLQLAEESGLRSPIDVMFQGEKINVRENRAVLQVALHTSPSSSTIAQPTILSDFAGDRRSPCMGNEPSPSNVGMVVSVRGSVVDIRFDAHLPPIYSLLHAGRRPKSPSRF